MVLSQAAKRAWCVRVAALATPILLKQALQYELRDVAAYAEAVSGGSNVQEALLWRHIHATLERIIAPLHPTGHGTTARYACRMDSGVQPLD